MGIFEDERYASGTKNVVESIAKANALKIVGGGDSAASVREFGFSESISHISTGGGASLELLAGIELPGFKALET